MTRRGVSLVEIMVCASVFLLAMVIMGELTVVGMRTRVKTEDKNQAFRSGTLLLEELSRDLTHCTAVLEPVDFSNGTPVSALALETWSSRGTPGKAVVGYRFDSAKRQVVRLIYDPAFVAGAPATQVAGPDERPETCNWIREFQVRSLDPKTRFGTHQVRCDVVTATQDPTQTALGPGPGLPLMTEVEWRGK